MTSTYPNNPGFSVGALAPSPHSHLQASSFVPPFTPGQLISSSATDSAAGVGAGSFPRLGASPPFGPTTSLAAKGADSNKLASAVTPFPYGPSQRNHPPQALSSLPQQQQQQQQSNLYRVPTNSSVASNTSSTGDRLVAPTSPVSPLSPSSAAPGPGHSPPLSRNTTLRKLREQQGGRISPYPPAPAAPNSPGGRPVASFGQDQSAQAQNSAVQVQRGGSHNSSRSYGSLARSGTSSSAGDHSQSSQPRSPATGTFRVTNMTEPMPTAGPGPSGPFAPDGNALGRNVSSSSDAVRLNAPNTQRRRPRPDTEEIKRTGRLHYEELLRFLRSHLAKAELGGPRSNARDKLTRLSKQQFAELSTDVYDELMRRQANARNPNADPATHQPHLAVRDEFHPKRNQARQKLATLPKTRFKDLGSDVFFELERRFPELKEEFRPEAVVRDQQRAEAERERAAQQQAQAQAAAAAAAAQAQGSGSSSNVVKAQPTLSKQEEIIPAKSTMVEEKIAVPYANEKSADVKSIGAGLGRSGSQDSAPRASFVDDGDAASLRDSLDSATGINGKIGGLSGLGALTRKISKDPADERGNRMSTTSSVGTGFLNGYAASTVASGASPVVNRGGQFEGPPSSLGVDRLRSDYEFRIATLQQRITTLESQNSELRESLDDAKANARAKDSIIGELRESHARSAKELRDENDERYQAKNRELEDTLELLDKLREEHTNLQRQPAERRNADDPQIEQLRQERDALQQEYAQQEEMVQELQGQVGSLMEELKELSTRNDEMMAENDSSNVVIRDLNQQVQSYKRKYENAKTELRTLKATSQLYVKPPKADDFIPASDKGAIADVHLTAFQSSIDELLAAARSKTPSNVLLAMKSVVLATTLVTDDVAKSEQSGLAELSDDDNEQLQSLKSKASATLNNLMTACRNHASSHGMSPVSLLDAAASHVSTTIVDLVKLLKVRKASKVEAAQLEATFTQDGTKTLQNGLKPLHTGTSALASARTGMEPPSPSTSERRGTIGRANEKFGSGAIADDRFSPRTRQPSTFGRYSPVGYRADVTRKDSVGEGSWKNGTSKSRANSVSSASSTPGNVPAVPPINPGLLGTNGAHGGSGRTTPDNVTIGSDKGRLSNASPGSALIAGDSGEENWAELRGYIETQTKEIFNSISALLSAIREGAQGVQLRENLTQIVTIVSSIVAISNDNLPASTHKEGMRILANLTENCDKLGEMQSLTVFDKTTKTHMASASYGVAKGLKALEGLLNDAEDDEDVENIRA
ncbi:hypothetical protein K437DRAFT_267943 [Tilletiaria anomala UBC 951]|uniref:GIT Spa2 homology (SHD) domain-containing protein n=1 Tax=Tilletiaria anomala (strain ATCC 24038 / CBS 436.72 / UBC 951) TaxID=1037660 RepID=A0A066W7V5_TILAU|nr:uncharacterized protein K437DRAFT_267943 [Tilletiaria anomala UBC 951]KDN47169.1 hypothetical protein K437DRAFT_267943 [Tilletiaria anomala UBC 951]